MFNRILSFIGMLSILGFIVATAVAVDKKANDSTAKRVVISKAQSPADLQRKPLQKRLVDDEVAMQDIKSIKHTAVGQVDTIFMDDFEGGPPHWQALGVYGNTPQGNGFACVDHSDWGLDTTNFNSTTTSWHESGVSLIQEDYLISPVIQLPTTVTGGEPLASVGLKFAMDWDARSGDLIVILAGFTEVLWAFDTADPGTGTSSWICPIPSDPLYSRNVQQFLTTPNIDLTSATPPLTLGFQYKSITEPNYDYNFVDVSTDNFETYLSVACFEGGIGTGGVTAWTTVSFNLDVYAGSVIKIRFTFIADRSNIEPGTIFALDSIDLSDAGGTIFSDDGGNTPTSMEATGLVAGRNLHFTGGSANPNPNWQIFDAGVDLLDGSDGAVSPGDSIRIAIAFDSNGTPPGRGLYIDDIVVTGEALPLGVQEPAEAPLPTVYAMQQNYPNPFNPSTTIQYELPREGYVTLKVYNLLGQEVATLVNRELSAGTYTTQWNAADAASGVYFYRMSAGDFVDTKKLLLLK